MTTVLITIGLCLLLLLVILQGLTFAATVDVVSRTTDLRNVAMKEEEEDTDVGIPATTGGITPHRRMHDTLQRFCAEHTYNGTVLRVKHVRYGDILVTGTRNGMNCTGTLSYELIRVSCNSQAECDGIAANLIAEVLAELELRAISPSKSSVICPRCKYTHYGDK